MGSYRCKGDNASIAVNENLKFLHNVRFCMFLCRKFSEIQLHSSEWFTTFSSIMPALRTFCWQPQYSQSILYIPSFLSVSDYTRVLSSQRTENVYSPVVAETIASIHCTEGGMTRLSGPSDLDEYGDARPPKGHQCQYETGLT